MRNFKKITKKHFKDMHNAGELQLICAVTKTKEEVMAAIEEVKLEIKKYTRPTSNYGNIETSKDGRQKTDIYISEEEQFIFIETVTDSSKDKNCSWNTTQTDTVAYLAC